MKTIVVQSPSTWREAAMVARAIAHITIWSAALIGASWYRTRGTTAAASSTATLPDVQLFRDLEPEAQRMFRATLEGLGEAEDLRAKTNDWPAVEVLAARHIPPFAPDPLDRAGYQWKLMKDGALINYTGTPKDAARPSFVISILEPDPSVAPDPAAATDETHHKLRDGTMLHVGIYAGPKPLTTPMATPAFEDGWRRITTYNP